MKRLLSILVAALLVAAPSAIAQQGGGFVTRDNCTTLPSPVTGTVCSQRTTASGFLAGSILKFVGSWQLIGTTEKRRYPAAGCDGSTGTVIASSIWDLRTTTPAVAACVGSNVFKGVLNFADTSGGFAAEMHDILPADWTTTGGMDFRLYWSSTVNTGNGRWVVQVVCTAVNASVTDDPAYPASGNGFNTVVTAVPGTAGNIQTSTITGMTLPSSCVNQTALLLHVRVSSDGQNASDTQTGTKSLIFSELTYRRLP